MARAVSLTPLELPGWVEFNTRRTGLTEHRFSATEGSAEVRAVFYLDRRGRLRFPRSNPYMPVYFLSERRRPSGRAAHWLAAAAPLVEEMRDRGVANLVRLPPDVHDMRPWLWGGFLVSAFYTYLVDFPFDVRLVGPEARRRANKAASLGMTVERVDDVEPVMECLAGSESRKGFSFGIDAREMRLARTLLGPDSLRTYVCFDREGQPAATKIYIHAPGARAVEWMAGVRASHLADGANYLLSRQSTEDLSLVGATGLDLCGANIEAVAAFKSQWGGNLVPTYGVRTHSLRAGARFVADWRVSRRRREPGR